MIVFTFSLAKRSCCAQERRVRPRPRLLPGGRLPVRDLQRRHSQGRRQLRLVEILLFDNLTLNADRLSF